MDNVFDQTFWNETEASLWDEIFEAVFAALLLGVDGGVNSLPPNVRALVDYDMVNRAVQDYASRYRFDLVRGINDTTRKGVQTAFTKWIESGQPLSALETQLETWFSPARASRIAVTEVTRIFAEGNREAWESTEIVEAATWMTANDDLVCPICGELDGTEIGIGDIDAFPPAHVNCRCWAQPTVDENALSRKLEGILA